MGAGLFGHGVRGVVVAVDGQLQPVASQMMTGRFTQVGEVVGGVLFPVCDRAGGITGADFTIYGGLVPAW